VEDPINSAPSYNSTTETGSIYWQVPVRISGILVTVLPAVGVVIVAGCVGIGAATLAVVIISSALTAWYSRITTKANKLTSINSPR
jgi:hypothetical protein